MSLSTSERARLADLLLEKGPDAPTLCEGWDTRDLAVHLWVRENRPDAAAGMMLPPLKGHLKKVSAQKERGDYAELVRAWAAGPAPLSPMRLVDRQANAGEHFVHLEDVRRGDAAQGGPVPPPREFTPAEAEELYGVLRRMAPMLLRRSAAPVVLQAPGLAPVTVAGRGGAAKTPVTVTGEVGELLLWAFGRDAVHVEVSGDASAVRRSEI